MFKDLANFEMLPSPLASRILSGYAIVFGGLMPAFLTLWVVQLGLGLLLLTNLILASSIVYHGARVLFGDRRYIQTFGYLIVAHYVLLAFTNLTLEAPEGTYAARMAGPRVVRNLIYAAVFGWYYLLREKTSAGFVDPPSPTDQSNE